MFYLLLVSVELLEDITEVDWLQILNCVGIGSLSKDQFECLVGTRTCEGLSHNCLLIIVINCWLIFPLATLGSVCLGNKQPPISLDLNSLTVKVYFWLRLHLGLRHCGEEESTGGLGTLVGKLTHVTFTHIPPTWVGLAVPLYAWKKEACK